MSRTTKIVTSFAAFGFLLPYLCVACGLIIGKTFGHLQIDLRSVAHFLGSGNTSTVRAIFSWLLIGMSNAVLYAILGIVIALIVRLIKPHRAI